MPTYLLRSRHGIWYFRCRLPISIRQRAGSADRPCRVEVRISLKTRNKQQAQLLALKRRISCMQDFGQPQPYELEADAEIEAYRAGKALIGKHQLNPHHRFGLDELAE